MRDGDQGHFHAPLPDRWLPACCLAARSGSGSGGLLLHHLYLVVDGQTGHRTILSINDVASVSITTPTIASSTFQAAGRTKSGARKRAP